MFTLTDKNKKLVTYGACAVIAVAACFQLYRVVTNKPDTTKKPPYVRTVTVGQLAGASATVYPGEVRGRQESNLSFQVAGKINQRLINLGDKVAAGQILMTLDPKDVNQSVEAANAALASAIANQKLAADNAERFRQLYAGGAVGKATYDQYATQLEAANATLRQAQASANAKYNQLEYTQLVSDKAGTVAALNGEVGQVVAAGSPMVTVVADGEREVQIHVPENALSKLRVGQKATVTFWALENQQAQGVIREIASMADTLTKTYKVCVTIENMPPAAKLGMTAKVAFSNIAATKNNAYLVPATAIYKVNDKTQVWVVREQKAHLVEVTVDGYKDNQVLISSGLAAGDKVITAGLAKLTEAQEVKLLEGGDQK